MKSIALWFPVIAFAAGTSAAVYWPASGESAPAAPSGQPTDGTLGHLLEQPAPTSAATTPGRVAELALAGAPSVDELFKAIGLDRVILMGRFLESATSDQLKEVFVRNQAQGGQEVVFMGLAALRWVELDREAALKMGSISTIWWAFAKIDPNAAFAAAQDREETTVQMVLFSIAQSDFSLALRLLKENPKLETQYVLKAVVGNLFRSEPREAVQLAQEKGLPLLGDLAGWWIERHPTETLNYAAGMTDPAAQSAFLTGAFTRLTAADPAAAAREAVKLPQGPLRSLQLGKALAALAREDPAAARPVIDSLPAGPDREVGLTSLAAALSDRDEGAAVALLATIRWDGIFGLPGNTTHAKNIVPAVQQLMTVAPLATANTLAALPFHPDIPISPAILHWAGLQPEAASSWVQRLSPGPAKDEAIHGLTEWLAYNNPEPDYAAALAWVAAAGQDRQFALYRRTIAGWKRDDRAAAFTAATQLKLPEDQRESLMKIFE